MSIPGITRILSSGHATPRAYEPMSLATLTRLVQALSSAKKDRDTILRIMPGSGINERSIEGIFSSLYPIGVKEYHMSGGSWIGGTCEVSARREADTFQMGMPGHLEWMVWRTDAASVRAVVDACTKLLE